MTRQVNNPVNTLYYDINSDCGLTEPLILKILRKKKFFYFLLMFFTRNIKNRR